VAIEGNCTKMNILCKYSNGYEMHGKWIYFDDNSQQNSGKFEAKLMREPAASRIDRMGERRRWMNGREIKTSRPKKKKSVKDEKGREKRRWNHAGGDRWIE
jgi:hypothetical protein